MSESITLGNFDLSVFATYMVLTMVLGFVVAGRHRKTAKGYFLGDRQLPWYVVGTSMIAADISTDDLIANAAPGPHVPIPRDRHALRVIQPRGKHLEGRPLVQLLRCGAHADGNSTQRVAKQTARSLRDGRDWLGN